MIISQIIGGLGNQMFQYAVGRAIATRLNKPLRLDVSPFANYQLHNGFELSRIFAGQMDLAPPEDLQRVIGWRAIPLVKRLLSRSELSVMRGKQFVVEPHFQHWADINRVPAPAYLVGYWQSEKYFQEIDPTIRADFVFRQPLSTQNQRVADHIARSNAVSLHVRRGDYVQNSKTFATHGTCSLDYYREAIRYVSERIEQPKFFIFSDDISWVRNNLKIDFPCSYVDHNHGAESYNDMRLMSLCQHNIIANSSFSWWAAWLNANHNKIVVAPKKWFSNNNDVSDLYPQNWIKL